MIKSFKGIGTIIMLHRVHPYEAGRIIYNENMKLSPAELESLIEQLRKENFVFISLNDLVKISKREALKERFISFTLDDGYKDNLEYAYPIFKRNQIPFCIYVTNCFPNATTNLWWYALEELVLRNNFLEISSRTIANSTTEQKNSNFLFLRRNIINQHFLDPFSYLEKVGNLTFNLEQEILEKCLTWNEIVHLSRDPMVTIGSHTMNHFPLSKLNQSEVRKEISASKAELEEKRDRSIRHFAFPFGSTLEAGQREYNISAEEDFDTITTAVHGHVYPNYSLKRLNRVFLYPLQNNKTTLNRVLYWNLKSVLAFGKSTMI